MTVCHVGVKGVGFVTEQPSVEVDRIVAASRSASSVRKPVQFPWGALGRLMKVEVMKIVLFGATGNVGRRLAAEALSRGHEVVRVVRDPAGPGSATGNRARAAAIR